MKKIDNKKLDEIYGGTASITSLTVSATLINSFAKIIEVIFDIGTGFGSSIRRVGENNICSLK